MPNSLQESAAMVVLLTRPVIGIQLVGLTRMTQQRAMGTCTCEQHRWPSPPPWSSWRTSDWPLGTKTSCGNTDWLIEWLKTCLYFTTLQVRTFIQVNSCLCMKNQPLSLSLFVFRSQVSGSVTIIRALFRGWHHRQHVWWHCRGKAGLILHHRSQTWHPGGALRVHPGPI